MDTTNLKLPYLLASQAQKHVTHNEALRLLDGLVQLAVLDRDLTAPPGSPADGDRYIVASGATGDWAGWDLNVASGSMAPGCACCRGPDGGPGSRMRACCWSTTARAGSAPLPTALQNMALLGLGTTADAGNPFSAKLNAALWTAMTAAEGGTGDLFYTMNKETAGDDLGLTLQTGFVTKALVGLFGSDKFRLAVSADGSSFFDGLIVDNTNGIVDQPRLPRFKAYTNFDNYVGVAPGRRSPSTTPSTTTRAPSMPPTTGSSRRSPAHTSSARSLLYKINASTTARMRGRLVLNGRPRSRAARARSPRPTSRSRPRSWLQTLVPLAPATPSSCRDTSASPTATSPADHTTFWGCKVG